MQDRVNHTMVDRGSIGLHDSSKSANFTTGDRRSSGLQWNSEVENAQKSWENRPRKCFMRENNRLTSRQSSVDSGNTEQNHDSTDLSRAKKTSSIILKRIPSYQQLLKLLQKTIFPKYYNNSILGTPLPTQAVVTCLISFTKTKSIWQTSLSKFNNHLWEVQVKMDKLTCTTITEPSPITKITVMGTNFRAREFGVMESFN